MPDPPVSHDPTDRRMGRPALIPGDALILLIGPAASGKSTWAAAHFRPSQVLSSDVFRELIADDASDQAASRDAFRLLHSVARARLERGLVTVIDATNLLRSARKPLMGLATRFGRPCVAVVFEAPLELLLTRNDQRTRHVPGDVLRHHHLLMSAATGDIPTEGYALVLHP